MLILLTGCALWFGEADLAPYPLTRDDLVRPEPGHVSGALPPTFATPTLRSVAPEPLLLDLSPQGFPERVELGGLDVPEAFQFGFRRAAGGAAGGTPVDAVLERFQVLCLAAASAGVDPGAYVVVEGAVRFGEGPWRAVEVTRRGADCELPEVLYEDAGRAFAGEVVALAANADVGVTLPPLPTFSTPPTLCVATDARPAVERRNQRAAEAFSLFTVGTGYLAKRGTRLQGSVAYNGRTLSTPEAEMLTDGLRRALEPVFPGVTVRPERCPAEPYTRVDTPTIWARLDHAFVEQYLRTSEWTVSSQVGPVAVTTSETWGGATEPFAYWRAGVALCVGDVCRGTTLAGVNDASTDLLDKAGTRDSWGRLATEALDDLGARTAAVMRRWVAPSDNAPPHHAPPHHPPPDDAPAANPPE